MVWVGSVVKTRRVWDDINIQFQDNDALCSLLHNSFVCIEMLV